MKTLQSIFVLLLFGSMAYTQSLTSISFDFNGTAALCENAGGATSSVPVGDPTNTDGLVLPGQVGPWNSLIVGRGKLFACCSESPSITADGMTFTLNTNNNYYETFTGSGSNHLRKNVIFFRNTGVRCNGPDQPNTELTWTITDLNPNTLYSLILFGQVNAANASDFSINGFDAGNGIGMPVTLDAENDGNFIDVRPDATGTITGRFAFQPGQGPGETFSGWSGLQIQATASIPTMGQWGLFILALILSSLVLISINVMNRREQNIDSSH